MTSLRDPRLGVNAGVPGPTDPHDVVMMDDAELLALADRVASGAVLVTQDVMDEIGSRLTGVDMLDRWRRERHSVSALAPVSAPVPIPEPTSDSPLPLKRVDIPAALSSDPPEVAQVRAQVRTRLDRLTAAAQVAARLGSPDPVAEVIHSQDAAVCPLERYLFAALVADRSDLAASFAAAAAHDYRARQVVVDEALPGLLPAELTVRVETPPASSPPSPPTHHHPPPELPGVTSTAEAPSPRYHKWCLIPATEVDAWAISPKGAAMLFERFAADHARVTAEVPATEFAARWRQLSQTGEVVSFGGSREVFGIISARAQDHREGVERGSRYQPPEHLKEQIEARRDQLWKESQDRRSGRTRPPAAARPKKKQPKKKAAGKPRLWQKADQLREFRERAAEWGITGHTQLVWRELWDAEGWVAGRRWVGHVAVTQARLVETLGIGESTTKRELKKLVKANLLKETKKERKGESAKVYRITFRPGYWEWIPDPDGEPTGVSEAE